MLVIGITRAQVMGESKVGMEGIYEFRNSFEDPQKSRPLDFDVTLDEGTLNVPGDGPWTKVMTV